MISVIISTRDRLEPLVGCVCSILANSRQPDEILIIDQSKNDELRSNITIRSHPTIKYHHDCGVGLSRARNIALTIAKGKILIFTDDDCIVAKDWLKDICQSFEDNKNITGVFGQVLPYKPYLHKDKICPCTFQKRRKEFIERPCLHYKNIGFGNNMAFKRGIFGKIGNFKECLGVGSIGLSAEDAEFALRVLLNGYKLLYNPKVKVYHNRWLTKEGFRKQWLSYACGEAACYGYFAFQGHKFAEKVVKKNFKDSFSKMKNYLKSLPKFKKLSLSEGLYILKELIFRLRGVTVAFWYSKKEPLNFVSSHKA